MKRLLSFIVSLVGVTFLTGILPGCAPKEEVLFNGKDLTGWVWFTKVAEPSVTPDGLEEDVEEAPVEECFSVKDGALHVSGTPFGYIRTEKKYADCTIHVEWRWAEGRVDSGIFVFLQDEDKVWPTGIQLQLRESDFGFLFSGLKLEGVEGPFCRKAPLCVADPELEDGLWNETVIVCKAGHITASVNGTLVNEAQCETSEGYIGFQSEGGPIEFRNIRVTY